MAQETAQKETQLTNAQRRRLFALARQLGLTHDDLRDICAQWTGDPPDDRHVSNLTAKQASEVIKNLEDRLKTKRKKTPVSPGMLSHGQLNLIRVLYPQLGWTVHQFRTWLKKYHKISHEEWIPANRAAKVIEGLKAMIKRTQTKREK